MKPRLALRKSEWTQAVGPSRLLHGDYGRLGSHQAPLRAEKSQLLDGCGNDCEYDVSVVVSEE